MQALHEMHKILSQVEILGSPIMLGSSLISGLSTFLAEPAKARNPSEFARGVGTGSVTLVKMASFGILTFIGQVSIAPYNHTLLCLCLSLHPRQYQRTGLQGSMQNVLLQMHAL